LEKKQLVIFLDSGDTLIDESTEVRDENDIVVRAKAVPGASQAIKTLAEQGYTLVLVADGEVRSFQNVLSQNGIYDCFSAMIMSEMIRARKPSPRMFRAAMGAVLLDDNDKKRIIMVGNNLARDVKGANAEGITSVFLDWSPRYPKTPADDSEKPDYMIHTPMELVKLAAKLEAELEREA
jgi:putative hydrolase of the HAD superfamily